MPDAPFRPPPVTLDLALAHGLTEEEYGWIVEELGRPPTFVELGIYGAMWSEHCSYKNSIALIRTLPREGERLLVGAGEENAGLVDIGEGLAVAFKIESHNHPSAVEPYHGAATGVGGIVRDIFTMGARPVATLNSLRLGEPTSPRVRHLLDGIARGIADYGNTLGVPTVGGEAFFDAAYEANPLVNAMSVGIVKAGEAASAVAKGAGNPVYVVGSATGREGVGGAAFASEDLTQESEARRPPAQVGDPYAGKLLLEATLEAIASGAVVGVQDMGAAGLTSSSCEMSARGGAGMDLHLERVPTREAGMTPYEIMLSESQERMLIVTTPEHEAALKAIFERWELHAARVGEVTEPTEAGGRVRCFWHGEMVADVPAEHLVLGGGAPVYHREARRPAHLDETSAFDPGEVPDVRPDEAGAVLRRLLGRPNIASKRWIFEQYDSTVGGGTVLGPGAADAAVVRVEGTGMGLALATDGNGRYVHLNPRRGGQIAVAEAARNVVCAGGRPLAISNCLNFGNPYRPEVYWSFAEAVAGVGEACRALGTPVTGGNVSFHNESPGEDGTPRAVFPTPTIGMLGLVEEVEHDATPSAFREAGDVVFLLAPEAWLHKNEIGGTEYLAALHGRTAGDAPHLDLDEERGVQEAMLALIHAGLVRSAHDVSDGGLAVCLAECALLSGLGAEIEMERPEGLRLDALLFGEAQSRIVFTAAYDDGEMVMDTIVGYGVQAMPLGRVGGERLAIRIGAEVVLDEAVAHLAEPYHEALPRAMEDAP